MDISDKIKDLLNTPEALDVKLLTAYAVKKSGTLTDDEIVENADVIAATIAYSLRQVNSIEPTEKQAKEAAIRMLEKLAKQTATRWDDRAVKILRVLFL